MSTVSVVIPAYNSAHLLHRSLASVLRQTRPVEEVLVVNDGSTDETAALLTRYAAPVRSLYQPNGGLSSARNLGIRNALGEWVAFLDADDQWLPEKIERQLRVAADNPEAGVIYTDAFVIGLQGEPLGRYLDGKGPMSGWIFDRLLEAFFVLPSTTMIRRQLLIDAGMFTDSLRRTEDYDLCLRLAKLCPFALLPEALTLYERQPDSISRNTVAEHESHMALYRRLLAQELTREQRMKVERRLRKALFSHAYALRSKDPSAALQAAGRFLAAHPGHLAAWKLAAGNLAARVLPASSKG